MKIIVGLGNPGEKYEKTRHNFGFKVCNLIRKNLGFPAFKLEKKFSAEISEGEIEEGKILLVKPQTFMNLSGESVGKLANFYKVELENVLIIFDDIDLPFGTLRIRSEGSAGGHKGVKSIIEHLGGDQFPRLRLGIEKEGRREKTEDFVLQRFSAEEEKALSQITKHTAEAAEAWITRPVDDVMSEFN